MRKQCPRCGASDTVVSRRSSVWRSILAEFSIRPYLCRACHSHFYKLDSSKNSPSDKPETTPVLVSKPAEAAVHMARRRTSTRSRTANHPRARWLVPLSGVVAIGIALYVYGRTSSPEDELSTKGRSQEFVYEQNVNRPGFDYSTFALPEPRVELCADSCSKSLGCKAFTYVPPLVEGAASMCYLKSNVPGAIADKRCITGVKSY